MQEYVRLNYEPVVRWYVSIDPESQFRRGLLDYFPEVADQWCKSLQENFEKRLRPQIELSVGTTGTITDFVAGPGACGT